MAIASLGMYDQPFLQSANDVLWQALRHSITSIDAQIDVPEDLNRAMSLADQWRSPDLLLSQTCGYPYITRYRDHLQIVATPVYKHTGCSQTSYSSFLIAARGASAVLADYRGKRLAANAPDSLSGYISLQIKLHDEGMPRPFFDQCIFCSAHARALDMVAGGQADICCIDAVTYSLLTSDQPALAGSLQIIDHTSSFPALPLVTSKHTSASTVQSLRKALDHVVHSSDAATALNRLGISEFRQVPHDEYQQMLDSYLQSGDVPVAEHIVTL